MSAIIPTADQLAAFMSHEEDGPFTMLNLIRFAAEPGGALDGEKCYQHYLREAAPLLEAAGGHLVWMGAAGDIFIGGPDDRWDRVLLVAYPSRKAFMEMIAAPQYQKIHKHREEGIAASVLIACDRLMGTA